MVGPLISCAAASRSAEGAAYWRGEIAASASNLFTDGLSEEAGRKSDLDQLIRTKKRQGEGVRRPVLASARSHGEELSSVFAP